MNNICPKCGETENLHYNLDYLKAERPVIDILCNKCGETFLEPQKISYGKVTTGFGTSKQREIDVVSFLQAEFNDHRLVCVSQLEDDSFVISVENPVSTGRNPQSNIWLSRDSFIAMLTTATFFLSNKDIDINEEFLKLIKPNDEIRYSCSRDITLKIKK